MLTYLLAMAVGLGSFSLYMAAFFFPEVHRKYDLLWSGVGMFYALVLWVCASRITGGVLLGQIASVALLGWLGWQTLTLRRQHTPLAQQTQLPVSATSATEVIQTTVQQFRANLQQSTQRSSTAARLNGWIDRGEAFWIEFTSWIKALSTTIESESRQPESPFQSPIEPQNRPPTESSTASSTGSPGGSPTVVPTELIRAVSNDTVDDFYAEWGELEAEVYPELDTVDGTTAEPGNHRDWAAKGSSRNLNRPSSGSEHPEYIDPTSH